MSANFSKIKKRSGEIVVFDSQKITSAIQKAFIAYGKNFELETPEQITTKVVEKLIFLNHSDYLNVEEIQDIVEKEIADAGHFEVAKAYILYRDKKIQERKINKEQELESLHAPEKLIKVIKSDGSLQNYNKKKVLETFEMASKGYEKDCPFDEVYEIFRLTLIQNIKTSDILHNLKKACLDLTSVDNIHWQKIAGRLLSFDLYKKASINRDFKIENVYSPEKIYEHYLDYVQKGLYYKDFVNQYTQADILKAASFIKKDRDMEYGYSTILAYSKRYLLNPNKVIHELPQEMYLFAALFLAIPEKPEKRLEIVKKIYETTSSQKLSLPTPTLLNARTNYNQLSSCFKLNVDDDLRSIYHNIENIAQISKFGGGVGVYFGHVRAKGSSIRGTKGVSGGVMPWLKVVNNTAIAVNQLGARAGTVSPTLDVWHKDIHDFLDMQTETGDIRTKAFDIFPAISVPDLFMQRCQENQNWTLFDPHEVFQVTGKRLEDFYGEEFNNFYQKCEKNHKIENKETVSAKDLIKTTLKTVVETGMPYFFFRDTVNNLNPNKHAGMVYSTQLCTEICQNTSSGKFVEEVEENGLISIKYQPAENVVCNLASVNVSKVYKDKDIKEVIEIASRILDNVITLNYYPTRESQLTAKKYRSIGLGFMGLAEHLAVNKIAYDSQEARDYVDKLFEKYAFQTLSSSNLLSEERGHYSLFPGSEWSKGLLFGRDEKWFLENSKTNLDWSKLISKIKNSGLRFAYHLSPAPNTSTAGVVGTTAGLLPIYKRFFVETNAIAPVISVAPNLNKENFWFYKEYRSLEMPDVIDMFEVIYKWIDQSASFEWMIDPQKTSPADLYSYYVRAWRKKIKTVYYVRSLSTDAKEACESCSG